MLPRPRIKEDVELKETLGVWRENPEFLMNSSIALNLILLFSKKVEEDASRLDFSKSASELVMESKFPYSCPECHRCFKTQQGLNQHKGKVHCEEIKWKACFLCGKKFKHKYAVRFHVLQVHKKATRTQCSQCHRCFYNKYKLNKHLLQKHS